jgi:predicted acylesterase/phospholipase RssA
LKSWKIREFIPKTDHQNQGYLTLLQLASSMMVTRISDLLLELKKPDLIINIPADSAKTFEFHKASKIIQLGRESVRQRIGEYPKKKTFLPRIHFNPHFKHFSHFSGMGFAKSA